MPRSSVHEEVHGPLPGHREPQVSKLADAALKRLNKRAVRPWQKEDESCLTHEEKLRRSPSPLTRLNEIIKGASVTPDAVLRPARVLGMPADFRLGLQSDWDLFPAWRRFGWFRYP